MLRRYGPMRLRRRDNECSGHSGGEGGAKRVYGVKNTGRRRIGGDQKRREGEEGGGGTVRSCCDG